MTKTMMLAKAVTFVIFSFIFPHMLFFPLSLFSLLFVVTSGYGLLREQSSDINPSNDYAMPSWFI